jgi:hypothetical protein
MPFCTSCAASASKPHPENAVQDKVSIEDELPYRYTAKEQDTETGLYLLRGEVL